MDLCVGMFKAFDIRVRHDALNDEAVSALARSIALYYAENAGIGTVVVARDARLYSPSLMEALVDAFLSAGVDVLANPLQISTCQFYFMCMRHPECGGVMITASHNPAEYVGIKLVGRNCSPIASGYGPAGGIDCIREHYLHDEGRLSPCRGHLRYLMMQDEYVDYSMRLAGVREGGLSGMRVFAEFLSGSGGSDFLMAFDAAGADLTLSHLVPDGLFPAGDPNPIIESSVAPARRRMSAGDYDMGFCFDGDADRMDLMYPDGVQVLPSLNMSVLVPYIRNMFSGTGQVLKCYADVKAAPPAVIRIARAGMEPHIIRNGHSFIKEKLQDNRRNGFMLAGEESAHCYMNFPVCPDDFSRGFVASENTLFFSLLSARARLENPDSSRVLREIQDNIFRSREWSLHFRSEETVGPLMQDTENMLLKKGAVAVRAMDDGSSLDAMLLRSGVPEVISSDSVLSSKWWQVAGRISRSEDAICRWEVLSGDRETADELEAAIRSVAAGYIRKGLAY